MGRNVFGVRACSFSVYRALDLCPILSLSLSCPLYFHLSPVAHSLRPSSSLPPLPFPLSLPLFPTLFLPFCHSLSLFSSLSLSLSPSLAPSAPLVLQPPSPPPHLLSLSLSRLPCLLLPLLFSTPPRPPPPISLSLSLPNPPHSLSPLPLSLS